MSRTGTGCANSPVRNTTGTSPTWEMKSDTVRPEGKRSKKEDRDVEEVMAW